MSGPYAHARTRGAGSLRRAARKQKKLTFGEVDLERVDVLVEAQSAHGPQQVFAVDGLALLLLALVAGLRGDEADKLRHALLVIFDSCV